jgi:hypothetical protein
MEGGDPCPFFYIDSSIFITCTSSLHQKLQVDEVEEDKKCGTHRGRGRANKLAMFWLGNMKGRNHLIQVGPARRILLK